MSSSEFGKALDRLGGSVSASAGSEASGIAIQVLSKNADAALELLAEMAMNPSFPQNSLRRTKQQAKTFLRANYSEAAFSANRHLYAALYGQDFPQGRFTTENSIGNIRRESLQLFYEQHYHAANSRLCVLGDCDASEMMSKLKSLLGSWRSGEPTEEIVLPPDFKYPHRLRLVDKPGLSQATILVGGRGAPNLADDIDAFRLANHILGASGFSSRLMNAVRSDEGKTYGVQSSNNSSRHSGTFVAQTFTRNEHVRDTLELVLKVIRETVENGVTQDELGKAKTAVIGQFPLGFENPGSWARAALSDLFHNRPLDYTPRTRERIAAITLDQVNQALKRYIDVDNLSVVIAGEAKLLMPQLESFGTFEVRREKGDWY